MKYLIQVVVTIVLTFISSIVLSRYIQPDPDNGVLFAIIATGSFFFWYVIILFVTGIDLKNARVFVITKDGISKKKKIELVIWIVMVMLLLITLFLLSNWS